MDNQNFENQNYENQNYGEKDNFKMEKPKRNNPIPAIILIAVVVIMGFLTYKRLMYKEVIDVQSTPVVETTRIERGKIEKHTSVMGTIMPSDTFYVVTKVSGEIKEIFVENGQEVKMGDKICEIDNSKQIEAAYIQYDAAKKAYDRMKKLFDAGDISAQSFESVKAQYEGAKLKYDTEVEFATPTATGDGVIENTNMTLNVTINQGTVLCYITSNNAKNVEFAVTERVLDGIVVGDKVTVEKQGKTYEGYITEKSNLISQSTGLFNVKAIITSENNLASGGMAKVNFVYERENNTDLIDRDIVYYENNKPFVYVVDIDNTIKKNFITLGISNDEKVEVKSGINKTTKLVSTWNNDLVEGVKVDILNEEAAKELEKIYDTNRKNDAELEKEEKYKEEAKHAKEKGDHEAQVYADINEKNVGADINEQTVGADTNEQTVGADTNEQTVGADTNEQTVGEDIIRPDENVGADIIRPASESEIGDSKFRPYENVASPSQYRRGELASPSEWEA